GHNSGVIHTGVYYKPGSLKAQLCVPGAREMLEYCRRHALPHAVPGKVIVATKESELPGLREIQRRGEANGVEGLNWLEAEELRKIEPHVRGLAALHVPTAAITDYAAVAASYAAEIAAQGGEVVTGAKVEKLWRKDAAARVQWRGGRVSAALVINCAGLHADRLARQADCVATAKLRILPFRGEYYCLAPAAAALVRGLVYPVPDTRFPFLGVHFTPRVGGGVEAGPSAVLAWSREGYGRLGFNARDTIDAIAYRGFVAMVARYWQKGLGEQYRSLSKHAYLSALRVLLPELRHEDLLRGGSGVRAQVVLPNGRLMDDFCVLRDGPFMHVINVPSPAATASLQIGKYLARQVLDTKTVVPGGENL
ncbi:MAG: L-2-hydroxyglutarate oxidase, partial [Terriglobales bacterium]